MLQKTQRASSEVTDFTTTTSATGELKILVSLVQIPALATNLSPAEALGIGVSGSPTRR
jgi:hypothetical protein